MLSNRDGGWGRVQYEVGYTVGCRTGNLSLNMFKFKQQKHDISFWWCKKWGETTPADLNKSLVWGSIYSNSKIITLLTSDIDCKQLRFDAVSAHVAWWIFQEGRRFFHQGLLFPSAKEKGRSLMKSPPSRPHLLESSQFFIFHRLQKCLLHESSFDHKQATMWQHLFWLPRSRWFKKQVIREYESRYQSFVGYVPVFGVAPIVYNKLITSRSKRWVHPRCVLHNSCGDSSWS